jgi:hypothetical protein
MKLYRHIFFYSLLFFYMYALSVTEYFYPVAFYIEEDCILCLRQTSPSTTRLVKYNACSQVEEPVVCSLYNPAGIVLLPDNKGFSFIDNGRLRIKKFHKRSPKTIDFDEPFFNIHGLHWIDEYTGYCSAQNNSHFSLYHFDDEGTTTCLMKAPQTDCMYPEKIDDQLFYIERFKQGACNEYGYAIKYADYDSRNVSHLMYDFDQKPIIFLHMISSREGFVLEHEKAIDSDEKIAHFFYHHLLKEGDKWNDTILFSFAIPTKLFLYPNDDRLFESILPLLPKIRNNMIYFVDYSISTENLEEYVCDLENNKISALSKKNGPQKGHNFSLPTPLGSFLT